MSEVTLGTVAQTSGRLVSVLAHGSDGQVVHSWGTL